MATIGKWYGRNRTVTKGSPGWVPPSTHALGPCVYDKTTGKWWAAFGGGTGPVHSTAYSIQIRERYATASLAVVNYQITWPAEGGLGLFVYNGFLYGLRKTTANGGAVVLFKVDPAAGTVTDVKTICSSTYLVAASMVFDGTQTVYVATLTLTPTVNVSKYDIGSDTLTSLRDETTYWGNSLSGIGLSGTTLYWMVNAGVISSVLRFYRCKMTTAGASFAEENSDHAITTTKGTVGFRGFTFFQDSQVVSVQGGTSFDLTDANTVLDAVFIDDSQGAGSERLFVWSHFGASISFSEFDGATRKQDYTVDSSTAASGTLVVASTRPASELESAVTFEHHDGSTWWEAPSKMKEVT